MLYYDEKKKEFSLCTTNDEMIHIAMPHVMLSGKLHQITVHDSLEIFEY